MSLLAGCSPPPEEEGFLGERLAPCSAKDTPFEDLAFEEWADYYRDTTDEVVEEHLKSLGGSALAKLNCTAEDAANVLPASPKLKTLAGALPPWKDELRLNALSQLQVGSVLIEFLRVYECANLEWERGLPESVQETDLGPHVTKTSEEIGIIEHELAVARPALERTLRILGGLSELRSVSTDLECLRRLSLDLRNVLGLIADASACLAKVPGKSSLRDLPTL